MASSPIVWESLMALSMINELEAERKHGRTEVVEKKKRKVKEKKWPQSTDSTG